MTTSQKPVRKVEPPSVNVLVDERRPRNPLAAALATERSRGVTSFRPDPPAEQRGVVNVTAAFCGDPTPGRREMLERHRATEVHIRGTRGDWS